MIPVAERVRTDFLWQRSPFLLYGGGAGTIESAGIDFILPYWMGRYYGMEFSFAVVSAASGGPLLAPDSIGSIFGSSLAASTQAAPAGPLPLRLGGVRVEVTDAAGAVRSAPLYFVSPAQINFVVPDGAAPGVARVAVVQDTGARTTAFATVQRVAPALFTANSSGQGPAAALAFRLEANGQFTELPVFRCAGPLLCYTQQIDVSSDRPVYLSLFGTGIRHRSSLAAVSATLGGKALPVLYAGPQNQYAGLD
ncbi:MAG: hypothetical protein HYZ57_14580, partial [Acidobacteria bacterium]|nr:hypothetical protein [Acidobacteriota bacterium]